MNECDFQPIINAAAEYYFCTSILVFSIFFGFIFFVSEVITTIFGRRDE